MNEARAKGEDVRRIASLKNIQTDIANQTNIGQLSYATIFSTGEVAQKVQTLLSQTRVSATSVGLKSDTDTYAIVFPLQKGGYWCVDSDGNSQYVTAPIVAMAGPYSCALAVSPTEGPGSIDDTFTEASVNGPIYHGLMQPDGKIILEGNFTLYNGVPTAGFVRLNSDGTVDTAFTANALIALGIPNLLEAIHITGSGQILIGGVTEGSEQSQLRRLNSDGTLDTTFSAKTQIGGIGDPESESPNSAPIYDITELNDGTIITARGARGMTAFNPSTGAGSDFPSFGSGSFVKQVAVIPATNEIVVGGRFSAYGGNIARNIVWVAADATYISNGTPSFDVGSIEEIFVDTVYGRIYVLGGFATYNGHSARGVVAMEYNGTYINSFDTTVGFSNSASPEMIGISTGTGYPVVVGSIVSYDNVVLGGIVRITGSGDFDTPSIFEHPLDLTIPGFQGGVPYVVLIQSDGKIVVAGTFSTYKGAVVGKVVRINP